MSATLALLPRKEFKITLTDGTVIMGIYNTWAIKRFCDKKKLSFNQLVEMTSDQYTIDVLFELVLAAVESYSRREGKPFSYTDYHVGEWIDDMGGLGNPDVSDLFAHMNTEEKMAAPPEGAEGEKKSIAGGTSSETTLLQVEQ